MTTLAWLVFSLLSGFCIGRISAWCPCQIKHTFCVGNMRSYKRCPTCEAYTILDKVHSR